MTIIVASFIKKITFLPSDVTDINWEFLDISTIQIIKLHISTKFSKIIDSVSTIINFVSHLVSYRKNRPISAKLFKNRLKNEWALMMDKAGCYVLNYILCSERVLIIISSLMIYLLSDKVGLENSAFYNGVVIIFVLLFLLLMIWVCFMLSRRCSKRCNFLNICRYYFYLRTYQ